MSNSKLIYFAMHDQVVATELGALLTSKEHEVVQCNSSRELIDQVYQRVPAMIIVGVLLPDANGLEVAKRLKGDNRTRFTNVVVLSSLKRSAKFSIEARTKFGADLYLELPMDPPDFIAAIESQFGASASAEPKETPAEKPAPPPPPPPPPPPEPKQKPTTEAKKVAKQSDFPESGRLGPVLLPELLLQLYQQRATGTLVVKTWEEQREIIVRDGLPIAIRSNFIHDDALGQMLIARGMVAREVIDEALITSRKEDKRLGEVLIDSEKLAPHELNQMLRNQAKRKVNTAFRWKEGSYELLRNVIDTDDTLPIEQDILSILIAGIGRHYDMNKLDERLYQNKDAILLRTNADHLTATDLKISKREWQILALIDGERTMGEVIAEAELNFARTFQVLYLFLLFGIVRFADTDRFFRLDEAVAYRARSESRRSVSPAAIEDEEIEEEVPEGIPNQGDLSKVSLIRFLYHLYVSQATGKLALVRGELEETVTLDKGMPVRIHSNRIGPNTLGNLLVAQGKISAVDRDRALSLADQNGRPLGEMLLAHGMITPHELYEALIAQLENKLVALFTWKDGTYSFEETKDEPVDILPITIDLTRLVIRGVRDSIHADRIDAELRKYRSFPLMSTRLNVDLSGLFSDPRENALISMIDGRHTLGEILERTLLDESHALQMIYSLLQLGLVKFKEE